MPLHYEEDSWNRCITPKPLGSLIKRYVYQPNHQELRIYFHNGQEMIIDFVVRPVTAHIPEMVKALFKPHGQDSLGGEYFHDYAQLWRLNHAVKVVHQHIPQSLDSKHSREARTSLNLIAHFICLEASIYSASWDTVMKAWQDLQNEIMGYYEPAWTKVRDQALGRGLAILMLKHEEDAAELLGSKKPDRLV